MKRPQEKNRKIFFFQVSKFNCKIKDLNSNTSLNVFLEAWGKKSLIDLE